MSFETNPFFLLEVNQTFWFIILTFLLLIFRGNPKIFNQKIVIILVTVWVLIILQSAIYGGGFTPAMLYKPIWIFYTPFLVYTLLGLKYFKYLFNIIYFIAIYTFVIYILQTISPVFNDYLIELFDEFFPYSWSDWPRSILIYSAPRDSGYFFMRNSGVFHEPGAYSIYLMLAIILNTYFTKQPLNKKNIFLAIVIITTFSTTGYIMLFSFAIFLLLLSKVHPLLKPIIIGPAVFIFLTIYTNTEFLSEKVENHYSTQKDEVLSGEKGKRGRFYAFGMAFNSISQNPVTGQGILRIHKFDVGESGSFGYGFAGLFAMYGVIFGIFYMRFFYKGFIKLGVILNLKKFYSIVAFIIINLGLLTQVYFFHTPFIFFLMIGLFLPTSMIDNIPPSSGGKFLNFQKKVLSYHTSSKD